MLTCAAAIFLHLGIHPQPHPSHPSPCPLDASNHHRRPRPAPSCRSVDYRRPRPALSPCSSPSCSLPCLLSPRLSLCWSGTERRRPWSSSLLCLDPVSRHRRTPPQATAVRRVGRRAKPPDQQVPVSRARSWSNPSRPHARGRAPLSTAPPCRRPPPATSSAGAAGTMPWPRIHAAGQQLMMDPVGMDLHGHA